MYLMAFRVAVKEKRSSVCCYRAISHTALSEKSKLFWERGSGAGMHSEEREKDSFFSLSLQQISNPISPSFGHTA